MKRLFETFANSRGYHAVVRGKNECGEYVVTLYQTVDHLSYAGKFQRFENNEGTYFTDDFDDACATALRMSL